MRQVTLSCSFLEFKSVLASSGNNDEYDMCVLRHPVNMGR